jgi:hypothetical protein
VILDRDGKAIVDTWVEAEVQRVSGGTAANHHADSEDDSSNCAAHGGLLSPRPSAALFSRRTGLSFTILAREFRLSIG